MTNNEIADAFSLLAKLTDIDGSNSFKSKSYAIAAYHIEKLTLPLKDMEEDKIATLPGIGNSTAKKIIELLHTQSLAQLQQLITIIPAGVIELLQIKGLGPKKINAIWKDMGLENMGELQYACKENRLKLYKGFGEKTQQSVLENIEFYQRNKGNFLYAQIEFGATQFIKYLQQTFAGKQVFITGQFARQLEIITLLEFIVEENVETILQKLSTQNGLTFISQSIDSVAYKTTLGITIKIYAETKNIIEKLVATSSSTLFYNSINELPNKGTTANTEQEYFISKGLPYIPAYLRENEHALLQPKANDLPIGTASIKGLIHCHSNWSDGNNTIAQMAMAAQQKGMEYLVITDHSKSAYYAQGLKDEQILAQHTYIDELNSKLAPFKIFKSIESDILNDGSLDYSTDILASFDVVIASIHSNLKMNLDKAMARLLAAIENPYTTILGHLTGRLLLSRPPYPIDYKKIIDACAANHVVIELNANPNRLDIDWREISYALDKNVLISINPDSHSIEGIDDIKYGVLVAQKAMLQPSQNLSSYSLQQFSQFVRERKILKSI